MVVRVIDIDRVAVLEPKSHAPIARHGHRIIPTQGAFQWMKLKPWEIHIRRVPAVVKRHQDVSQLRDVLLWQPPCLALFVEGLEPAMLKRLIHNVVPFFSSSKIKRSSLLI